MRQSSIVRNAFIVVCLVACLAILISAMSYRAPATWTQTYTSPQGVVMEPDHGAFYYWWLYHLSSSQPQPSYHVHVHQAPSTAYRSYTPAPYQPAPKMKPIDVSTPAPSVRTGGGFSAWGSGSGSSRSSGGFRGASSGSSRPPSPSGGYTRSGGGFSSSSSGGSSRSGGGFSSSSRSGGRR